MACHTIDASTGYVAPFGAIAEESMRVAAEICIYTNANLTFEEL
mgnify:CR=1 FL=1